MEVDFMENENEIWRLKVKKEERETIKKENSKITRSSTNLKR